MIAVIDYGMGNLRSVSKAVEHVAPGAEVRVTDDPAVIAAIVTYLSLVPISYGFQGVLTLSTSALNVLRKPLTLALNT